MRRISLLVLLAVVPFYSYADMYTTLVRTGEPVSIPYKLSLKEIEAAIIDGSVRRGWEPKKLSDGTIEDTLHIRSHIAVVHVVYTAESYRIDYADSSNLTVTSSTSGSARYQMQKNESAQGILSNLVNGKPDEVRIHKNYYEWANNLANYINQSLGEAKNNPRSSSAKADGDVPGKLRALEGLRKDGIITAEEYQKKKTQLLEQF